MVARIVTRLMVVLSFSIVWIPNLDISRTYPSRGKSISVDAPLLFPSILESDLIYVPGSNNLSLQTAISQVSDQGTIEISAGTYYPPLGGFTILDQPKSFTIRAEPGATVILHGQGQNRLINFQNSALHPDHFVTFEGIIFSDGYSHSDGVAAIIVNRGNAIFIDCVFRDNRKDSSPTQTVGGALTIFGGSTVYLLNTLWENNWSQNGGAAVGIRDANLFVHNSIFRDNQIESISQSSYPCGAAINLGDSVVRITNSTFDSNISGSHGAAIWAIGTFGKTKTDVIISNSTFIHNYISRIPPVIDPIEGGAIAAENNLYLRIYNSRFIENNAFLGGAMTIFRAQVEIYDSVFRGNRATDILPTSGFGGTISFNYHDRPDFARLRIEDTLIQGRYGETTTSAQYGGGLSVIGLDSSVKPEITLRRVVFYDTDSHGSSTKPASGGAISLDGVKFSMEDSFVLFSDARHPSRGGIGGGINIYSGTLVDIDRCVFANNSADSWGGGLSAIGANIDTSESILYANEISPGVSEGESYSPGAAAYVSSDTNSQANGIFEDSLFLKNIGMAIYDNDLYYGPINATVYNHNQFYESTFSNKIYKDSLTSSQDPSGLNNLVVNRASGVPSTDKSLINNTSLTNPPIISELIAVPSKILAVKPAGDPQTPRAWLAYLWEGSSAQLDGVNLNEHSRISETFNGGQHTLSVDGMNSSVQIDQNSAPNLSTSYNPGPPGSINWDLIEGTYLDIAISQGISFITGESGSATVPATGAIYYLYMVTEEGGVLSKINTYDPILLAPTNVFVLAGQNMPVNLGYISISNGGGQTLEWTASTSTPELFQILTPSGQTDTYDTIILSVNPLPPNQYTGYVNIDAQSAGTAIVTIDILVVPFLSQFYFPVIGKN